MLTDADAGNIGINGPKLAAKLDRCVGLEIPSVDGAEAAVQKKKDKRDIFCRLTGFGSASLSR
jgi:hypothetical protein